MMRIFLLSMMIFPVLVAGQPKPTDFAYQMELRLSDRDAFYQLEIPAAVYRGVAHSDLRDLRVYNSKQEIVPHGFRQSPARESLKREAQAVRFFPLLGKRAQSLDQFRLEVQQDGSISSLRLVNRNERGSELLAYVIDASNLQEPLYALNLEWPDDAVNFSVRVRLEASDDLANWTIIQTDAALLNLNFAGQRLLRQRIEFTPRKAKYFRLSWSGGELPSLKRALVEPTDTQIEVERRWYSTHAIAGAKPGEYTFDLGGVLPLDRIRIDLPEHNTLVQAEFWGRNNTKEQWQFVTRAALYRLQHEGLALNNPDLNVVGRYRYWQLQVDARRGGLGQGLPTMQVGWLPHQLIFIARGEPPLILAYGNQAAQASALPLESLIPGYREKTEFIFKRAEAGEQQTVAGQSALREPIDWRKWLLWSVLVLGVLALGAMAWRLMQKSGARE